MLCRGEDAKHKPSLVASQQPQQPAAAKAPAIKLEGMNPLLVYICPVHIMPAHVAEARLLVGCFRGEQARTTPLLPIDLRALRMPCAHVDWGFTLPCARGVSLCCSHTCPGLVCWLAEAKVVAIGVKQEEPTPAQRPLAPITEAIRGTGRLLVALMHVHESEPVLCLQDVNFILLIA